jgi:hypothetical protein
MFAKPYEMNREDMFRGNEFKYDRETIKETYKPKDEPRHVEYNREKVTDDYQTRHFDTYLNRYERDMAKNTLHSEEEKERPYSYAGWRNTEGTQESNESDYKYSPQRQAELLLDRHEATKQEVLGHFTPSAHSSGCSSCECSEYLSSHCSCTDGSEESGNTPPLPIKHYTHESTYNSSDLSARHSIESQGSLLSFSHSEPSPRPYIRHSTQL